MSKKATTRGSRYNTVAGSSPAIIFSKSVGISYASDGSGPLAYQDGPRLRIQGRGVIVMGTILI
jgi:hypothetical protein